MFRVQLKVHHRQIHQRDWERVRLVVRRRHCKRGRVSADQLGEACLLGLEDRSRELADRHLVDLVFLPPVRRRLASVELCLLVARLLGFLVRLLLLDSRRLD